METPQLIVPFQLQFDKPIASQMKIAEWNPEKDLLAMVTEDSKILLHRFNWQRLWTISPGREVTSLCWRPDGKVIAVGLDNGTISLHDVENGKLMKSSKLHDAAVTCLTWEEDADSSESKGNRNNPQLYEDRTDRFFPPAPRAPRVSGIVSADSGIMEESYDSHRELLNSSYQRFHILCSGDKSGIICFSIFGIFPIGKVDTNDISVRNANICNGSSLRLSIYKIALSKNLCRLVFICSGQSYNRVSKLEGNDMSFDGMHCIVLDTSIFSKRKQELHRVAQQASNIEDLLEVIRESISVMSKQWSDATLLFQEKFSSLSTLITNHALDSCPKDEFLSLLFGARTSPAIHQFLVSSLGEVGWKRVSKVMGSAGKELQRIVLDHLQPAAEIIGFRLGELRGLSRWPARYKNVGLDETLLTKATEKSGMMLIQAVRFMKVLSSVDYQFTNFFNWLLRCIKQLMQEPGDQIQPYNSELVVMFLKFLYDQDPVRQLLDLSEADNDVGVDVETMQRVKELAEFGGYSDCEYLRRTLAKEFKLLSQSVEDAFMMPVITISKQLLCENLLPLLPIPLTPAASSKCVPVSISFYDEPNGNVSSDLEFKDDIVDYIAFEVPPQATSKTAHSICVLRGFVHGLKGFEAALLSVPEDYECVDLSMYKDSQIIVLLNNATATKGARGCMLCLQAGELQFVSVSRSSFVNWVADELKDSSTLLRVDDEKARRIPHSVMAPLAVSASRGVACVFASRKRALVYILDEDEEGLDADE